MAVGKSKDNNVVKTGGANQLKSVTSSNEIFMTALVNTEDQNEADKTPIWPYQVTEDEILTQQRKWHKLSYRRYREKLGLMAIEQPALHAFLLDFVGPSLLGPEKNWSGIVGISIWLTYRAKFKTLKEAKDCDIGVNCRSNDDYPIYWNTFDDDDTLGVNIAETVQLSGPYRMMLNALEKAVNPRNIRVSFLENFRKRCWIDADPAALHAGEVLLWVG